MSWHDIELPSDHEIRNGTIASTRNQHQAVPGHAKGHRTRKASGAGLVIVSDDLIPWE